MNIVPPTGENIARAAEALRAGRLVGMPTETVYGLAANALDPDAVRSTFAVKGRPADNPLIVHLADFMLLRQVAAAVPPEAEKLARKFWPGPLTLVLPKLAVLPDVTTGGLDTVAVRVPAHPVARALIGAAGVPVSAPSANLFMRLSPTRAEHIDAELGDQLAIILDGGPCEVGLESTVVSFSDGVRVLRPGRITAEDIQAALGVPVSVGSSERRSPGMYPRHYAPRKRILLVDRLDGRPGVPVSEDPIGYGAQLYAALHDLDASQAEEILVERPPDTPKWAAIWDRLRRAMG